MIRPSVLLSLLLLAAGAPAAEEAVDHAAIRDAELASYVAWLEKESGWFTIRHPDPRAAARTEPLERVREDLARVLNATEHLLPARKPVLMETVLDPTLPPPVRFALATFLSTFHATVRLDRDERLRVEGIRYGLLDYDYSRAITHMTRVVLREFRGQPTAAVVTALHAAGWPASVDDITYVVETVAPSVRLQ